MSETDDKLIAQLEKETYDLRIELERAYRAIGGLTRLYRKYVVIHPEALRENSALLWYHSVTIAAARRFILEGVLEGSQYFIGKPVETLMKYFRN